MYSVILTILLYLVNKTNFICDFTFSSDSTIEFQKFNNCALQIIACHLNISKKGTHSCNIFDVVFKEVKICVHTLTRCLCRIPNLISFVYS